MRFVSKSSNYTFIAQPDKVQMVLGPGGVMIPQTVVPAIVCDFVHGMCRPDESMMAAEKWLGLGAHRDGTPVAFGATPSVQSGVVNGVAHRRGRRTRRCGASRVTRRRRWFVA
jgi:gamma-glutamyltranspeptidase